MSTAVQFPENPFDLVPASIQLLIAGDKPARGYGYGPGWSIGFDTAEGQGVFVEPGQWVVRHDDGSITVEEVKPEGAEVFDWRAELDKRKGAQSGDTP